MKKMTAQLKLLGLVSALLMTACTPVNEGTEPIPTEQPMNEPVPDAAPPGQEPPEELPPSKNILVNGDFSDTSGKPWLLRSTPDGKVNLESGVVSGKYCVTVSETGDDDWVRLFQPLPSLPRGNYDLQFDAKADKPIVLGFASRQADEGAPYVSGRKNVETSVQTYTVEFTQDLADTKDSRVVFSLLTDGSRNKAPFEVCLDNVQLTSGVG